MKKIVFIMIVMFFANRIALVDYMSHPDPVMNPEVESSDCLTQDVWNWETSKHFASIKIQIDCSCMVDFMPKISFISMICLFIVLFPYLLHMNAIYVMRTHAP